MDDRNVVKLELYQHIISDHPELMEYADKDMAETCEIGACMKWRFIFEKHIADDLELLKEHSVDFLLDSYGKGIICYKAVSSQVCELTVYAFFKDMDAVEECLKRRAFAAYQAEIERDYKLFMRERNLLINYIDFDEPQELLGTSKRKNWFTLIYLLISFPIFVLFDSEPVQTIFFIGVIGLLTLWGVMYKEKHK